MHILTKGTISQNRFLYLEINVQVLASTPSAVYLVCTRVNNILERKAREIAAKCYDEYVHSKNSPSPNTSIFCTKTLWYKVQ